MDQQLNSKQRRKDRRKWPYRTSVNIYSWQEYERQWYWCVENFGKKVMCCGWRERILELRNGEAEITWEFTKKKSLVEFLLRWGCKE